MRPGGRARIGNPHGVRTGTNYANVLPNDALADVLGRAMRQAGGYDYSPDEQKFADALQKTLGAPVRSPAPRRCRWTTPKEPARPPQTWAM